MGCGSNWLVYWITRVAKELQWSVAVEQKLLSDLTLFAGPVWGPKYSLERVEGDWMLSWVNTAEGETHGQ